MSCDNSCSTLCDMIIWVVAIIGWFMIIKFIVCLFII